MSIEHSTVAKEAPRLSRDDWLNAALKRCTGGIDTVKVAPLAAELGVTTGSFYWHFKDRRELLHALLEYWEREMTDVAMEAVKQFRGSPTDRILYLMENVTKRGLARYDLAILLWAQTDGDAARTFRRVLRRRFEFTAWLYSEVGFPKEQAEMRGRMTVVYMMGEATLVPDSVSKRVEHLRIQHELFTSPKRVRRSRTSEDRECDSSH